MNNKQQHSNKQYHYLSLFIFAKHLVAYHQYQDSTWELMQIQGAESYPHKDNPKSLAIALDDISNHLNLKSKLADVKVSLIYQHDQQQTLSESVSILQANQCEYFQILNWESLYQFSLQTLSLEQHFFDAQTIDHVWMQDHLLPLVWHETSVDFQQQALAKIREEKNELEEQLSIMRTDTEHAMAQQLIALENGKINLEQQITDAREKLAKLQQPDMESLVTYLPAIFKDFWNVVRPDELAMIVGMLTPPTISSPYHSPSLSSVQQKKRQFLALSESTQNKILDLSRELSHNHNQLQVHQEFKSIVGNLD